LIRFIVDEDTWNCNGKKIWDEKASNVEKYELREVLIQKGYVLITNL
jgi:hypothetical protein